MKHSIRLFFILFCLVYVNNSFGTNYNIVDYGARNDGKTLNTAAFRKAIDAAASAGGGTVYVPAGRFLSGTIELKSNIILYLEAGAVIAGSQDFNDYPKILTRDEGLESYGHAPLIYGRDLENISVMGKGTIDGQGKAWWVRFMFLLNNGRKPSLFTESEKETLELNKNTPNRNPFIRPCLVQFLNCRNVELSGITLINSPKWTVNPIYCENVLITGITIINPENAPNGDGINPDSCTGVRISDCYLSTGDDCVTIKSGKNEDGRRIGKPCENITITNCVMLFGHGGVVIGSEMSGGIRNVVVSNCVFKGTDRGIRFKAPRGRGNVIEDISFNNIIMEDIRKGAIVFDMIYTDTTKTPQPVTEKTPEIRNVFISNVRAKNVEEAFSIVGIAEMPISNIKMSNLHISAKKAGRIDKVNGLSIKDSYMISEGTAPLEFRNVKSLKLDDFGIDNKGQQAPLYTFVNTEGVIISGTQERVISGQ